jgi:hypothetical protein
MVKHLIYIFLLLLINKIYCARLRTVTKSGVSKISLKKIASVNLHAINFVSEIQDTINDYSECNLIAKFSQNT